MCVVVLAAACDQVKVLTSGEALIGWSDATCFEDPSAPMITGGNHLSWGYNGHQTASFFHHAMKRNVERCAAVLTCMLISLHVNG